MSSTDYACAPGCRYCPTHADAMHCSFHLNYLPVLIMLIGHYYPLRVASVHACFGANNVLVGIWLVVDLSVLRSGKIQAHKTAQFEKRIEYTLRWLRSGDIYRAIAGKLLALQANPKFLRKWWRCIATQTSHFPCVVHPIAFRVQLDRKYHDESVVAIERGLVQSIFVAKVVPTKEAGR